MATFVRMGSFRIQPGTLDELRRLYLGECAPLVKAEPGNLDCCLLESTADAETVSAWTEWVSEAHAQAYEQSGAAQRMVGRVKHLFAGPPSLQSFRRHTP